MNVNWIFDPEKVRKMRNLGNVVFAGSPLCYEQNQCADGWTAPLGAGYMEKFQPGLEFQPGC